MQYIQQIKSKSSLSKCIKGSPPAPEMTKITIFKFINSEGLVYHETSNAAYFQIVRLQKCKIDVPLYVSETFQNIYLGIQIQFQGVSRLLLSLNFVLLQTMTEATQFLNLVLVGMAFF